MEEELYRRDDLLESTHGETTIATCIGCSQEQFVKIERTRSDFPAVDAKHLAPVFIENGKDFPQNLTIEGTAASGELKCESPGERA